MAECFQWSAAYDLEVGAMNDEHKQLVAIMNRLIKESEAKASRHVLGRHLRDLLAYTAMHFEHEEAYMESIRYPKLNTHRGVHRQLLQQLEAHARDFEAGDGRMSEAFFDFLKRWLIAHIKHIDGQYSTFSSQVPEAM